MKIPRLPHSKFKGWRKQLMIHIERLESLVDYFIDKKNEDEQYLRGVLDTLTFIRIYVATKEFHYGNYSMRGGWSEIKETAFAISDLQIKVQEMLKQVAKEAASKGAGE